MPILGIIASQISGHLASPSSFESIATVTLTGNQNTISFTSIPSTYKHLQIRGIGAGMDNTNVRMTMNNDSGSNYSYSLITAGAGYGGSVYKANYTTQSSISVYDQQLGGNTYFNIFTMDILNYAQSSTYKSVRSFAGSNNVSTNGFVFLTGGLYFGSTTAINRLDFFPVSNPFYAGTSFALYGIKG